MPRLRCLIDTGNVAPLTGLARRIRRLHELLGDMNLQNPNYKPPAHPDRYLLVQEYADQTRRCGQAVAIANNLADLGAAAAAEMGGGWMPAAMIDLNTGERFQIELRPVFVGTRAPDEARRRAQREVAELAADCEYAAGADYTGDALIDYKDGLEDRVIASLARRF